MSAPALEALVAPLIEASAEAGVAIMDVLSATLEVRQKDDLSPVTLADERAERIVLAVLAKIAPDIPVIAEESFAAGNIPETGGGPFFLVDPLDGTKEFIRGRDSFTVNIALIEGSLPVFGVVFAPATDILYLGIVADAELGRSASAFLIEGLSTGNRDQRVITTRRADPGKLTIVASRSHRNPETEAYLSHYPDADIASIGSSLKFCLLATGEADLYPRLGPTMEWDTAAGQAILMAAGGDVLDVDGTPFGYRKPGYRNGNFVARGDTDFMPKMLG